MDYEILTLTPDPENRIVGIRLYPDMPTNFNSEEEMSQWMDVAIADAFELKEAVEMGYCDMRHARINLNPNAPASEVDKLKKMREDSKCQPRNVRFYAIIFTKKNLEFRISLQPPSNWRPLARSDGWADEGYRKTERENWFGADETEWN